MIKNAVVAACNPDTDNTRQGLLAYTLPTPQQTLLLRACLQSGASAVDAWQLWLAQTGSPKAVFENETGGLKGLLPFIEYSLRRNGIAVEPTFQAYLRAASVREELRNQIYVQILAEILDACRQHGVDVLVIKGAALSETYYTEPKVRHNHAIDLLMDKSQVQAATQIITGLKFHSASSRIIPDGQQRLVFEHETGLALELHTRLFCFPYYQVSLLRLQQRSQTRVLAGRRAQILSPADNLLQVLGHASYSITRTNLRWVCDTWYLIHSTDLDWNVLLDEIRNTGLAAPLHVMLGYLKHELEAQIPKSFMQQLAKAAKFTGSLESEALLAAAVASIRSPTQAMRYYANTWQLRLRLLKFLLVPSPTYVRWKHKRAYSSLLLPLYYLYRPMRFMARRALHYSYRWSYLKKA